MVRVGATLRELRETRGLTVTELAGQMGISQGYLSNIETGRKRLTPALLVKACRVLGVRQAALVRPDHFSEVAS